MSDKKLAVEKVDKNMAVGEAGTEKVVWHTADDAPMRLTGFYFRKKGGDFRRLPLDDKLPPSVNYLCWHTAGGQLSFVSDTAFIRLKVNLAYESLMDHCTKIGSSGFDLYMGRPGGKQYFIGSSRIKVNVDSYELDIFRTEKPEMREFTLHFPLYCGVGSFAIGFSEDAEILAPSPWCDDRPAQNLYCFFFISVRFGKRFFTFHHSDSGLSAEFGYVFCSKVHYFPSC